MKKITKGWAVVSKRGSIIGGWPYHIYTTKMEALDARDRFAYEHKAGAAWSVVKVEIRLTTQPTTP